MPKQPAASGVVSLSVLMPALNEAENVEAATRGVLRVADDIGLDVEILVLTCVDRNTVSDGTVDVVRRLASVERRIRSLHADRYQTLGEKFRHGIRTAVKTHLVMIPGDNELDSSSFAAVFRRIGEADVILCPPSNPEVRPWHRRSLSWAYTALINRLFEQRVPYYNGMNVYRMADLRETPPASDSFAVGAEIVLRLLWRGRTWVAVPVRIQPRRGRSKALHVDNVLRVVGDLVRLRRTRGRAGARSGTSRVQHEPGDSA